MQKNLKKVNFLKKFCPENLFGVTQPLNFFVQKSWLDMHMIGHKFQKNCMIRFKNSFCQSSNFEAKKSLLPVIAFRNDYIHFNSRHKNLVLVRRKYTQTHSFDFSLFSSKSDPFDHQKPILCIFKTQNHVSFVD